MITITVVVPAYTSTINKNYDRLGIMLVEEGELRVLASVDPEYLRINALSPFCTCCFNVEQRQKINEVVCGKFGKDGIKTIWKNSSPDESADLSIECFEWSADQEMVEKFLASPKVAEALSRLKAKTVAEQLVRNLVSEARFADAEAVVRLTGLCMKSMIEQSDSDYAIIAKMMS